MRTILIAGLIALGCAAPAAATAKPPLSEVKAINDGLLALGIADEIRNTCDDIDARLWQAYGFIGELLRSAEDLGYSRDEIETFRTSKAEKKRLRKLGEAYLAENGVSPDDPDSLCRLGREEIARGSQIGQLLQIR
jgi:hypothetical protein